MGRTFANITLSNMGTPKKYLELTALVDTGSDYTQVPARMLKDIGVSSFADDLVFRGPDGKDTQLPVGLAWIRINDREMPIHVSFGDSEEVLLGVMTLEAFNLAVDPKKRELVSLGPYRR